MRYLLTTILVMVVLVSSAQDGHEGHDHSGGGHEGHDHGAAPSAPSVRAHFSISESTEKAEYVVHFKPFVAGQKTTVKLFVSDFNTNVPIDSLKMIVTCDELNQRYSFSRVDPGIYEIDLQLPENKAYELTVKVNAPYQETVYIHGIEPGKTIDTEETNEEDSNSFTWLVWLFLGLGCVIGLVITLVIKRNR